MPDLSKWQFGPFFIDVPERVLRRNGQPVPLTPKAFDLLAVLVENPGRLLSKEELLGKVWPDTYVEESNLAYNVFTLRKALGEGAENAKYIETVAKRGYRFTGPVTPVNSADVERLSPESPAAVVSQGSRSHDPWSVAVPEIGDTPTPTTSTPLIPSRSWDPSWRLALIILGAVLVPVLYFAAAARPEVPSVEPLRARPLTSEPGVVRSPTLSPDGKYVAFSWTGPKQDNPDLYVQQIESGAPQRLTTDPRNDYSPTWSPDGQTIAFLRRGPAGGKSEVWQVAPLGGSERKLGDVQPALPFFRPMSISWCPDSSCVLVTDAQADGKPDAIFAISVATREKRQLTHPNGLVADVDPAISPDGRWLVFRRDTTPFTGEFYRQSLKSPMVPDGEPVQMTAILNAGRPTWTSDSRAILFSSGGALWRQEILGHGVPARLPFVGQDGYSPVVSRTPDGGQRLVYLHSVSDSNIWRLETDAVGAPSSSPQAVAIATTRADFMPSLSPDGQQLAFLSNRSGEQELWIADVDGSKAVQITSMARLPGFPRWSTDGKLLTFHSNPRDRPDVLVVPAAGGKPTILTQNVSNGGFPSFSRDGQWIYFTVVREREARIWKIPSSGGAAVQVTDNAGTVAIESYDRRDLYYVEAADRPSSLWRLPLTGGAPVKLVDGVVLGNFDVVEGGVYYIDRVSGEAGVFTSDRPGGETRLQYFDCSAGRSTTVARNLGTVGFGLTASRDGRTIFYSRVDSSIDELMVVDHFR